MKIREWKRLTACETSVIIGKNFTKKLRLAADKISAWSLVPPLAANGSELTELMVSSAHTPVNLTKFLGASVS